MSARRWRAVALTAFVALVTLHLVWHLWLAPPRTLPVAFVLALAPGPLLIAGLVMLANLRRGLFWAGFIALAYFSHGIMEAWASPDLRALAHAEWVLATLLVLAVGAAGLAERRAARRAFQGSPARDPAA